MADQGGCNKGNHDTCLISRSAPLWEGPVILSIAAMLQPGWGTRLSSPLECCLLLVCPHANAAWGLNDLFGPVTMRKTALLPDNRLEAEITGTARIRHRAHGAMEIPILVFSWQRVCRQGVPPGKGFHPQKQRL